MPDSVAPRLGPDTGHSLFAGLRSAPVVLIVTLLALAAYLLSITLHGEIYFILGGIAVVVAWTALVNFPAAFLYVPITLTNPYTLSETGTRLHVSEFVLLIIFAVWVMRSFSGGTRASIPQPFLTLGMIVVGISVLSLARAMYLTIGIQQIVRYVEVLLLFFLIVRETCGEFRRMKQVFLALIIGGLAASIVGLVQFVLGALETGESHRIFGWHGGGYGALISSTLLFCIAALLYEKWRPIRLWALGTLPFAGTALVLSQTRAWIGAFALTSVIMVLISKNLPLRRILIALVLVLAGILLIVQTGAFGLLHETVLQQALSNAFRFGAEPGKHSLQDLSLLLRFSVWNHSLNLFLQNPVLGIGAGNLRFANYVSGRLGTPGQEGVGYVDNQYIQFFVETGIVGGIVWLLYVLAALHMGLSTLKRARGTEVQGLALGLFSSLLIFTLGSLFWVITPHHELFALMILDIALLANIRSRLQQGRQGFSDHG